MKQFPDEKRQAEILKEIQIAEQKAREMAEFADKIAKKWEQRLPKNPAAKPKVGEKN